MGSISRASRVRPARPALRFVSLGVEHILGGIDHLLFVLCLVLLTAFVTIRLRRLPIGRAWEALREDEIACRSLGINTTNTKLTAFSIGAMFGGFAGAFFATRQGFISPESFTFHESAYAFVLVLPAAKHFWNYTAYYSIILHYGIGNYAHQSISAASIYQFYFMLCQYPGQLPGMPSV